MPHDHNHAHCDSCSHADDGDETNALAFSLFNKIDNLNFECLNEAIDGTGIKVFKPWHDRLNRDIYVESDCDAELLMNIPFTGDVKLTGIAILASSELKKIRLYKSKMRLSFDSVTSEADQEFSVDGVGEELLELPLKPTKFSNVHHLTIHFVNKNISDDENPCKLYYIGLRGTFTTAQRDAIVITNYELRPTEGLAPAFQSNTRPVH